MEILGFLIVISAFIAFIFYLKTLKATLMAITEQNRKMSPGSVYLNLIPILSFGYHFYTVLKIKESLVAEFKSQNIKSIGNGAIEIGIATCALMILSWIPEIGKFAGIAGIICWIIYWSKISNYKSLLLNPAESSGSPNIGFDLKENDSLTQEEKKIVAVYNELSQKRKDLSLDGIILKMEKEFKYKEDTIREVIEKYKNVNKQATDSVDIASVPAYHQPTPEIKKPIDFIDTKDLDYCQNCGKKGSKQYNIFSKKYSFCSQPCCDDFGNRLYYVSGKVFCPYCGAGQPLTKGSPRICGSCSGNMDELPEKIIGAQMDSKLSQCIQVIEEAEKNLSQSNSPEYEIGLYTRLLESPGDAIQAIKKRSWARRGTGQEEANRFCLRVLETIYKSFKEREKTGVVAEIVNIFKMQDDNTTGWLNIVDLACKTLDQNKMLEAKPELMEIEKNATGKNKQAINFALELLNKHSATKSIVHQERFIDNGNSTITDTKTGLMWQKEDDGFKRTLKDSEDYCKNLTIGGHHDWRLPTIDELSSLSKDWKKIFTNPKDDEPYWSNTVLRNPYLQASESQKFAAKVMFSDGEMNQFFIIYEYYARAVRKI